MKLLLLRPYYGVTVHSDMAGDMGIAQFINHTYPDLSLIYAAAIARNSGLDLTVLEGNAAKLLPGQILLKLKKLKIKFNTIILKATAPTIQLDIVFAIKLKKMFPNTQLILVGHVVKVLADWLKSNVPEIDWPASEPLEDVMNYVAKGIHKHLTLNQLPLPDYTSFPYDQFISLEDNLRGTLYTSRGCSFRCSYCPYISYYGNIYEERELFKVIEDIKHQMKLGIRQIQFRDQYFTYNRNRIIQLCQLIKKEKLEFSWTCETRIDSLDPVLIDHMIEAGMTMMVFGIESASDDILRDYHRSGVNREKAGKIIHYLNSKNISTIGFYIIGFPGETNEMIMDTYRLALELKTTFVTFNIWTPYPLTKSWTALKFDTRITPQIFAPFENRMNIQSGQLLDYRMLEFAEKQLTMMYNINTRGLESAFMDVLNFMPEVLSQSNPAMELFSEQMQELENYKIYSAVSRKTGSLN